MWELPDNKAENAIENDENTANATGQLKKVVFVSLDLLDVLG